MRKLLLLDDDPAMASLLGGVLRTHGFELAAARTPADAGSRAHDDAVALLVGLEGLDEDGLAFLRRLRAGGERRPVVALSRQGADQDAIRALKAGADDYLVKPFNYMVLVARLEAVLRRVGWRAAGAPAGDGLVKEQRAIRLRGRLVTLTAAEYRLLEVLTGRAGKAFPRAVLWEALDPGGEDDSFDRAIDLHMSRLRAKLEVSPKEPRHLLTVRGVGYRFEW